MLLPMSRRWCFYIVPRCSICGGVIHPVRERVVGKGGVGDRRRDALFTKSRQDSGTSNHQFRDWANYVHFGVYAAQKRIPRSKLRFRSVVWRRRRGFPTFFHYGACPLLKAPILRLSDSGVLCKIVEKVQMRHVVIQGITSSSEQEQ